ncbi:CtsR family transcriptional regulator [Weissella coleopterorum]|uniref:CtsR family transcriptional regulator n=1 Tax=Weissella coleopterorum TaxID=2714949 RepID=A0A6G8B1Y7_9LACO|nr:CtsR family transcriptional regulator [Weissella coleopterorum]QIL51235.1 CtsR family transcriptional regulator [Weissella coleopterorum]
MTSKNMTDIIEAYLLQLLQSQSVVEIRRVELAQRFEVVPSQINYVLRTRFSTHRGYLVDSKRGGSGYIKIARIDEDARSHQLKAMLKMVSQQMTVQTSQELLQIIQDMELMTAREVELVATLLRPASLNRNSAKDGDQTRAHLMQELIERLRFEIIQEGE